MIAPARSRPPGAEAPGRDRALGPTELRFIAKVVREAAGIALPEGKATLVEARLGRRLRSLGLEDFRAYCALIGGGDEAARAERQELVSAITTNVTHFFREPHHFETLRERVLPPLIERAERGGRVRLWSAGCSTGQEPYSIALTLLDLAPDIARRDVLVLASDLDPVVLGTASRGIYPQSALGVIPAAMRARHLRPLADGSGMAEIGPGPRELVRFRRLNLSREWPMRGTFDVIFCRNVVIYFDSALENSVWSQFAERLPPGGWLFVGHSERVDTVALPEFASSGVTTYRRVRPVVEERAEP